MRNILLKSILFTLILSVLPMPLYSQDIKKDSIKKGSPEQYNLTLLSQAKISIQQAQEAALKELPGQVIGIYLDSLILEDYIAVYRVYILTEAPQAINIVTIDAKTLKILDKQEIEKGVFPSFQLRGALRKPVPPLIAK